MSAAPAEIRSPSRRSGSAAPPSRSSFALRCSLSLAIVALSPFGSVADSPSLAPSAVCDAAAPVDAPTTVDDASPAADPLPERLGERLAGTDWPTLLGPTQDGRSSETGLSFDWDASPPRIVWQREVGEGYAIGSTSLGRYVHFDRVGDQVRASAVEAETGKPLWEFRYPTSYRDLYGYDGGPRCGPVIDAGRVYLLGPEGMLHCLALADGRLLWKRDTSRDYGVVQNFFGVGSTPTVHGDLVWVMVGGSPDASRDVPPGQLDLVEPNGSLLVAFDKRTGEERHRLGNDLASYSSLLVAKVGGRKRLLAFARSGLWVVDPAAPQNEPIFFPWRARNLESVNASMPVVDGNRILIGETYGPGGVLLELTDDERLVEVWSDAAKGRDKSLQTHWNTPVLHDGFAYASSGRHTNNAELRCIELATGTVRWREPRLTRCSMTYVDGHLLCQAEDGLVRLLTATPEAYDEVATLDLENPELPDGPLAPIGRPGARRLLNYPCWAAPIVSHGLIYVRGEGRVVCLDPGTASQN
ncbi:MAG TPA: PQQ-binding-like beta-propeller repeat protein [Pirellulaceae bacterium]|nr:PQQ-binding-like beta-propeller repeat protein [Pirellulaceae bacterium]